MFGISLISTKSLRALRRQSDEKDATILLHENTIIDLRKQVEDITPKRGPGGRFVTAAEKAEVTGVPV